MQKYIEVLLTTVITCTLSLTNYVYIDNESRELVTIRARGAFNL